MIQLKALALFVTAVYCEEVGVLPAAEAPTLWDVYGPVEEPDHLASWHDRAPNIAGRDPMHTPEYERLRSPDHCVFPIDVVILQDTTSSFSEDFEEMRNVQLDLMHQEIEKRHPGSRYGLVTFQDKPIWTLGYQGNYCQDFKVPLTTNFEQVKGKYSHLQSYAGGDMQENQLGALYATAMSSKTGWDIKSLSTRLIILITDAHNHFDADKLNKYGLKPFEDQWSDARADEICLSQYYPSPEHAKNAIIRTRAHVAFLIHDNGFDKNLTTRNWKWFNNYIGQTDEFLGDLGENSSNFWPGLSNILENIESFECPPETTVAPTPMPPTTPPVDCYPGRVVKEEFVKGIRVMVLAEDGNELDQDEVLEICKV